MAALVRNSTSIALLVLSAGCASATSVVETQPIVEKERTIHIEPKDGGWKFDELADYLHRVAGVSVLWDSSAKTFKIRRLFVGPIDIADRDLFAWLQLAASDRDMTLVPVWRGANGRRQWLVLEESDGAVFVESADVPSYANRAGLRIATCVQLATPANAVLCDRLVQNIPELKRDMVFPGARLVIVSGPAPAVAAAQREIYRLDAEAHPADAPPPPPIDRSEP
jgi:hypothetical protein